MSRRTGEGTSRGHAGAKSDASEASQPNDAGPASKLPGGLYLVATPIGNLGDITLRALDVLRRADLVACEDTRLTAKLLARHGIRARLTPYHDHNAERARAPLLARLARGQAVALVSDAGTPLISDPGFKLLRACLDAGFAVTAAPGPSAAIMALVLSGLATDRFFFAGFLPARAGARRKEIAGLAQVPATLLFFESAKRLPETLADLAELLGNREAAVARELTKLFEEVRRAPLLELAGQYREEGPPKGEVVVVVGPPQKTEAVGGADLDALIERALEGSSVRDAATQVAGETGLPRRKVYARALALARKV
jgi:16S rRNA (cytidine1402-2'-O)-methyltransferase